MIIPPQKKRKVSSEGFKESHTKRDQLEQLEKQLDQAITSSGSLNSLKTLIDLTCELTDPSDVHAAIWSLYRLFSRLIREGHLFGPGSFVRPVDPAEVKQVKRWLIQRFSEYTTLLVNLLHNDEHALRVSFFFIN